MVLFSSNEVLLVNAMLVIRGQVKRMILVVRRHRKIRLGEGQSFQWTHQRGDGRRRYFLYRCVLMITGGLVVHARFIGLPIGMGRRGRERRWVRALRESDSFVKIIRVQ